MPTSATPLVAGSWRALVLAIVLIGASCGGDDELSGSPVSPLESASPGSTSTSAQVTTATSAPQPTSAPEPTSTGVEAERATTDSALSCEVVERTTPGEVERVELVETSGLVASRRHPGVLWATNDSGQRSGIYAIDEQGRDLGFFALTDDGSEISTVDVEDLAIVDGTIYLADIGDNGRRRDTVAVHLLDEPEPGGDGQVELLATVEFRYPDGPTDAEALIVDPDRNELVVLSKNLDDPVGPTRLYTIPLPSEGGNGAAGGEAGPVEATEAGLLDVAALTAASEGFSFNTLLFPGSVTGADLSPAGDLVALRTYGSVWLFRHQPGRSIAESLTLNEPCEGGSAAEAQGETVAFLAFLDGIGPGTIGYVTISEGDTPPINATTAVVTG